MLFCEEICEAVLGGESSEEEEEEEIVVERPKMVDVRHHIDELIRYVDTSSNSNEKDYYEVLRSFRETFIRNQHNNVKQLKIDSFLQQKK